MFQNWSNDMTTTAPEEIDIDQTALYIASMTCGVIAVTAFHQGRNPSNFKVACAGPGVASFSCPMIDRIKGLTHDLEDVEEEMLRDYALLLRAAGPEGAKACHDVLMELARRACPDPAVLNTLDGKWTQYFTAVEGHLYLTAEILTLAKSYHDVISPLAGVLMNTGALTEDDIEPIVLNFAASGKAAAKMPWMRR
jgi:hypothetical protein